MSAPSGGESRRTHHSTSASRSKTHGSGTNGIILGAGSRASTQTSLLVCPPARASRSHEVFRDPVELLAGDVLNTGRASRREQPETRTVNHGWRRSRG